jgi:hypothetical protein
MKFCQKKEKEKEHGILLKVAVVHIWTFFELEILDGLPLKYRSIMGISVEP